MRPATRRLPRVAPASVAPVAPVAAAAVIIQTAVLPEPRPKTREPSLLEPAAIIATRVVRVRLSAARCTRGRGGPGMAGQLPYLPRRERAAPVAAVPASHALRFFYAVAWVMVVVVVVVVVMTTTHCGWVDIVGGRYGCCAFDPSKRQVVHARAREEGYIHSDGRASS